MPASGGVAHRFRYRAARRDGSIARGTVMAPTPDDARHALESEGLAVLRIRQGRPWVRRRRVQRQDLAVVFRNVAILTESGVPVERALAASELLVKGELRASLGRLRAVIREGRSVSDGMATMADVFPRAVVGMILAGERGSSLPEACAAVAEQLEQEAEMQAQLKAALAYPALILFVGVASVLVMGTVVVPRFAEVLSDLGGELPPATRALLAGSAFLTRHGWAVLLAAAGAGFALLEWLRRPAVRRSLDAWLLGLPVVGPLRLGFASARTCRALGGMLGSGMPLLAALEAARDASGDHEIAQRMQRARDSVVRGEALTRSLEREVVVTPLAIQLVGVGESSGQLAQMTRRAGDVAAERAQRALRAAVSLLEPLLVVTLGIVVAFIAAALLQAVYSVRPGL